MIIFEEMFVRNFSKMVKISPKIISENSPKIQEALKKLIQNHIYIYIYVLISRKNNKQVLTIARLGREPGFRGEGINFYFVTFCAI